MTGMDDILWYGMVLDCFGMVLYRVGRTALYMYMYPWSMVNGWNMSC